jgi:uncharacterized SAM-binding protein YcdF (DUF218 family)
VGLVLFLGLLFGLGAILIVADPVEPVDAIVVLSGDDGDRLALAIEMHGKGMAPNLVLTNTQSAANRRLRQEALAGGFSENQLFVTNLQVEDTVDEAVAVLALTREKGWDSLMIVTDPYHSLRARTIFRREFRGSGVTIHLRPIVGHWFTSRSWFLRPQGWQFVFLEYGKLLLYLLGIK